MTLPAFAELPVLAARLPGGIRGADEPRAQAALDDASALIRGEVGRSYVTDNELALPTGDDHWRADVFVSVCLKAALRTFENPESFNQEAGPSGPVDVYLTRSEKRLVRRAAGLGGIRAMATTRGTIETASVRGCAAGTEYLPVDPAGKDIPFSGPDGY